ncbi:unnamed protein product [Cylindrotheca closterium]|uniref:Uncharacterized protein n=1 Tax=Cylindrotheca closterium TaxID=2856 RepID=A0AAD2G5E9_9STRA|nr:unnamed protein product [Cylindrotheca closterium]
MLFAVFGFILSLALALANGEPLKYSSDHFEAWMDNHGKDYNDDKSEYEQRFQNFLMNSKVVENHNQAYEKGYTSYAMSLMKSPFADLTDAEFEASHLMAWQNCSATTHPSSGPMTSDIELPKHVDWRTKGIITPIKNQKMCGSCWTFSTSGCLEAHTCLNNPDLDCTTWTGLAEQQLLDCAGDFDNHGCNGGLPSHAFEYIKYAGGMDSEQEYPYLAKENDSCQLSPLGFAAEVAQIYNITSGDEDDLTTAIAAAGPVSVAYQVSPDFRFYSHGVYDSFNATTNHTMCKSDAMSVNHAVVAVGYGETEAAKDKSSVPYYIIRNSWSTSWGMEGYFWIKRGENLCGISDCASYPIVPRASKNQDGVLDVQTSRLRKKA